MPNKLNNVLVATVGEGNYLKGRSYRLPFPFKLKNVDVEGIIRQQHFLG